MRVYPTSSWLGTIRAGHAVCAALLLLTGCGSAGDDWPSDRGMDRETVPSPLTASPTDEAVRQAAASLSVINSGVSPQASASGEAAQCAVAIEASADMIRASPLVGEAEYRQVLSAAETYAVRAREFALQENLSLAEQQESLAELRDEAQLSPQQSLRTALNCIRALATGA